MMRIFTDEHRRKISEAHTGLTQSPETRQKISATMKINARRGYTMPTETREKLSRQMMGNKNWKWRETV